MFDNIGEKIKLLAKVNCVALAAAGVICGFAVMFNASFFIGLLVMVGGALAGWTGSFVLYGFGEVVEAAMVLRDAAGKQKAAAPSEAAPAARPAMAEKKGYSLSTLAAQRDSKRTDGWVCKKCGKLNTATSMNCKECAASR